MRHIRKTGTGLCEIDGCTLSEKKSLFDATAVKFFEGPLEPDAIEPGRLGVNIDLFYRSNPTTIRPKRTSPAVCLPISVRIFRRAAISGAWMIALNGCPQPL